MSESVVVERDGGVTRLTLNKPDKLNAIDEAMFARIHEAVGEVGADEECRVLVITGAGRGFCAGFDLVGGDYDGSAVSSGRTVNSLMAGQERIADIVRRLRGLRCAVVAAVNGPAAGAGLALALAADIRIASTTAKFIVAPVKIGLSAGEMGISYFLPRLIGLSRATEMCLTGRAVGAEEAERIGLVHRAVAPDELAAATDEVVASILANAPFSIWMTRELLAANVDAPSLDAALHLENRTQVLAGFGPDMAEAVAAFREKRPPIYGS